MNTPAPAELRSLIDLLYREVIEYMQGPHSAALTLIGLVNESDVQLETLVALVDACLGLLSQALVNGMGQQAALDYARGMLLHNELSRIEER